MPGSLYMESNDKANSYKIYSINTGTFLRGHVRLKTLLLLTLAMGECPKHEIDEPESKCAFKPKYDKQNFKTNLVSKYV